MELPFLRQTMIFSIHFMPFIVLCMNGMPGLKFIIGIDLGPKHLDSPKPGFPRPTWRSNSLIQPVQADGPFPQGIWCRSGLVLYGAYVGSQIPGRQAL